jgi:phosphate transport system substrate-binding protein
MKHYSFVILMLGVGFLLSDCQHRDKKGKILDTPTAGSIKIAVDESLRPLLEAEIDTFQGKYTGASVTATYTSEAEALDLLIKDSVRLVVVTRKFNKDEEEYFKNIKIIPHQLKIASEAVALILHRDNPDTILHVDQLKAIMQGKITQWNQLSKTSKLGNLEMILDNPKSGIARFLKDSVVNVEKLPANFYGVSNNKAVVDYVSQKPNAIGLIGVSWISDRDDSTASQFLKTVKVASISGDGDAVQPYQAYIANHEYPLRRFVYILSREARSGLGTGFSAFVAGDKGQRIVLKSGMVPATMPVRIVVVNKGMYK